MQSYQYLAAVTAVANTIDAMPGESHKMPYSVIAEWMEQNGIDAEDVLFVGGDEVRALVEEVIQQNSPKVPRAA